MTGFFFHMVPITEVFIAGSLAQIHTHPRKTPCKIDEFIDCVLSKHCIEPRVVRLIGWVD